MPRRKRSNSSARYERLETRSMLAGNVFVNLAGTSLIVVGNSESNVFTINLEADSTEGLVQGQDETNVRFSDSFDSSFDPTDIRRVRVFSGVGDDVVTIYGNEFSSAEYLTVSLGHGDDCLYVIGSEFQKDAHIYAGAGHDSISFFDTEINENLAIYGHEGFDTIVLSEVSVGNQTRLRSGFAHDSILVNDSNFSENVYSELGQGSDRYESVGSTYSGLISVRGRQGDDMVMLNDSNNFDSSPHTHTVEREADIPNSDGRAGEAIDQVKSDFFSHGSEMTTEIGNRLQNELSLLATAFDVELIELELDTDSQTVALTDPTPTVSVLWDQAVQTAVEATGPGPTIASRAYAILHTAMYDAWSAYDGLAVSTVLGDNLQRSAAENTDANKTEAMSFAAYRVLDDLFGTQTTVFNEVMEQFGFDPDNSSTDVTTAAGIGNRMAAELLEVRHEDGSNQLGDSADGASGVAYSDTTGYTSTNSVGNTSNIEDWTPEYVPIDSTPGTETRIQSFLTPHWGQVESFGLSSADQFLPEAPEPFLLVDGEVDLVAQTITLSDGTEVDIDASLVGTVINPAFISQAEEVVELSAGLTDEQKLVAEFWEDGGGTSFPPGTFMTFGEFVSARDNNSIDDDAKMFFALGNAVFDAGVATWETKVVYDYTRPVRAIRELGKLGLIGEFNSSLGGYAIDAWTPDGGGTQTILATDFLTYQTPGSDVSPPFAEYTSGHSAFSAAGATILEMFTGSDEFNASVTFDAGTSRFEPGTTPAADLTLSWPTFSAAADEAGLSRLYGGIHFIDGDVNGRTLGEEVGQAVWNQAQFYINGGV